jgi:anti-anti-sigma factor
MTSPSSYSGFPEEPLRVLLLGGEPDTVALKLFGELDLVGARLLEETLREHERERPERITLDLSELEFMDSSGLKAILEADGRARNGGWRLRVVRGPEHVQRLFHITQVDRRLEFVDA